MQTTSSLLTDMHQQRSNSYLALHDALLVGAPAKFGCHQRAGRVCQAIGHGHLLDTLAQSLLQEFCEALVCLADLHSLQLILECSGFIQCQSSCSHDVHTLKYHASRPQQLCVLTLYKSPDVPVAAHAFDFPGLRTQAVQCIVEHTIQRLP